MEIWEKLDDLPLSWRHGVMALGMFDGLHLGHQRVIRRAAALAAQEGVPPIVLTFRNHPLSVIAPEREPLYIEEPGTRREVMEQLGVRGLLELPFTAALARVTAADFLARLVARTKPSYLVVGRNYSFGDGGQGNPAYLRRREADLGYRTEICPLLEIDGKVVSSTRIRELLHSGLLLEVNRFLGRPFAISGIVSHGDARGRSLGFPTANLSIPPRRAMLTNGVYAVQARFAGWDRFGIANIGNNPTFGGETRRLEIHLLDFAGDLYDAQMKVQFIARLRDERRFPSAAELQRQLCADEAQARKIFYLQ